MTKTNGLTKSSMMVYVAGVALVLSIGAQQVARADNTGMYRAGEIAGVFLGGLYDNDGNYISAAHGLIPWSEPPALMSNPCMPPMGTLAGVFGNEAWDNDGRPVGPVSEQACWLACGPTPTGPQCGQRCACMRVGSAPG